MARYCKVYPEDFERYIWVKGKTKLIGFEGMAWFESKEQLKVAAQKLRKQFRVLIRAIVIPKSYGGYNERYLLMVSTCHVEPEGLMDAIKGCEGYTLG